MGTLLADFRQKKNSRLRFYGLLLLLLLFCFAEYVFRINIPQAIYLAAAFLIALTGDADEIIAMCVCCIPLHNFFEFSFAVLFGSACYVTKYLKRIRLNYSIVPVVLMVLWELMHCFSSGLNIMQFGGGVIPWILLGVLMCSYGKRFDYEFIVRAFAFTVAVMCFALFSRILYTSGFSLSAAFANLYRLGVEAEVSDTAKLGTSMVSKVNANTLGVMCVLSIAGLMQLRLARQSETGDTVLILELLLFGVMTASKTFFFCLVFALLLLLFSTEGGVRGKMKYIFGAVAVVLVVLTVSYLIMPGQVEFFISRFFDKDFTTGRTDHMVIYNEYILSNPDVLLFGIGVQDFGNRVLRLCEKAIHVPHNAIQELIIAWGLPGLAIYVVLWSFMFIRSRRLCSRQGLINSIPLLVLLLKIQAGQMVTSSYTMLAFSFAYLSMCAELKNSEEGSESTSKKLPEEDSVAEGLELSRAVGVLWSKKIRIAAFSVACAVAAFGITHYFTTPTYESKALFYVNNSSVDLSEAMEQLSLDDIRVSKNLVDSYIVILKARSFLDQVIEYTGDNIEYSQFLNMLSASAIDGTEILQVAVRSKDPAQAERLANGIAMFLPEHISSIIEGTSTRVVDYAVIASESMPRGRATNAIISFMLGFVLIIFVILMRAMANTLIQSTDDIVAIGDYPLLASIPDMNDKQQNVVRYGKKHRN